MGKGKTPDYKEEQLKRINDTKTKIYNTDECVICQEKYSDNFCILSCNHKFDINCLMQSRKKICPMCRKNIPLSEYNEIKKLCTIELPDLLDNFEFSFGNLSFFGFEIRSGTDDLFDISRIPPSNIIEIIQELDPLIRLSSLVRGSNELDSQSIGRGLRASTHNISGNATESQSASDFQSLYPNINIDSEGEMPDSNPILYRDTNTIFTPSRNFFDNLPRLTPPINIIQPEERITLTQFLTEVFNYYTPDII